MTVWPKMMSRKFGMFHCVTQIKPLTPCTTTQYTWKSITNISRYFNKGWRYFYCAGKLG